MGVRGIEELAGRSYEQTILVTVNNESVNPAQVAEVLTRVGYQVQSVETEGSGTWEKV